MSPVPLISIALAGYAQALSHSGAQVVNSGSHITAAPNQKPPSAIYRQYDLDQRVSG